MAVKPRSSSFLVATKCARPDIMEFHQVLGRPNEGITCETAPMSSVQLNGSWSPCVYCSESKVQRHTIPKFTENRADRRAGQFFVPLSGPSRETSFGGGRFTTLCVNDYTRIAWSPTDIRQPSTVRHDGIHASTAAQSQACPGRSLVHYARTSNRLHTRRVPSTRPHHGPGRRTPSHQLAPQGGLGGNWPIPTSSDGNHKLHTPRRAGIRGYIPTRGKLEAIPEEPKGGMSGNDSHRGDPEEDLPRRSESGSDSGGTSESEDDDLNEEGSTEKSKEPGGTA